MANETLETVTRRLPGTKESIYSNFDHVIDSAVVEDLKAGDKFAQHAAWDFCGYVYHDKDGWHEEVWRWGALAKVLHGDSAESVIAQANEEFGSD